MYNNNTYYEELQENWIEWLLCDSIIHENSLKQLEKKITF